MKQGKPEFNIFLKTRLRNYFRHTPKLVYAGEDGTFYRDSGSVYTALLGIWFMFVCIASVTLVDYTTFGFILWVLAALLHRLFRYFWTDFDIVDEQGKVIPGSAPVYERRRKRTKLMAWYLKYMGEKETEYKVTVSRYTQRQKLLAAVLGVVLLGLLVGSIVLQVPVMRFHHNPQSGYLEYAGDEVCTVTSAYDAAHAMAMKQCPDAELISCNLYFEPTVIHKGMCIRFYFRNTKANLLIHRSNELLRFDVYSDGIIVQQYEDNLTLKMRFSPTLPELQTDMNTDVMRDKALAAAELDIGDMESMLMVPVISHDSSADIWNVTIRTENGRINLSIDMAQ